MRVVRRIADLTLDRSRSIGLVPTMGAFHEGHLSLMRKARAECRCVVVSLFVNPSQFGPSDDLATYPRDEERDASLAQSEGVDVLFTPDIEQMYPSTTTIIEPRGVALRWEGERRPGHFAGVATIVAKLFNIVMPNVAYFGLKDFQQCAVISQIVSDFNWDIAIRREETVRESDGLALSSRNVYLSESERGIAPILYHTIEELGHRVQNSDRRLSEIEITDAKTRLEREGFRVDYLEVVDERTLEPGCAQISPCRVIVAAYLGRTRLIDNVAV